MVRCGAPGGILPPDAREAWRANERARRTAPEATPCHVELHNRCAYGAIVRVWIRSKSSGRTWPASPLRSHQITDAASAAHTQRVPGERRLQCVVLPTKYRQHLLDVGRLCSAPRRRDNRVGVRSIGNTRCVANELNSPIVIFDWRMARPNVSAARTFRRRRSQ